MVSSWLGPGNRTLLEVASMVVYLLDSIFFCPGAIDDPASTKGYSDECVTHGELCMISSIHMAM